MLESYVDWRELDWEEAQKRAAVVDEERERLLAVSSKLAEIESWLARNEKATAALDDELKRIDGRISVLDHQVDQASKAREQQRDFVAAQYPDVLEVVGGGGGGGVAQVGRRGLRGGVDDVGAELVEVLVHEARVGDAGADRTGAEALVDPAGRDPRVIDEDSSEGPIVLPTARELSPPMINGSYSTHR